MPLMLLLFGIQTVSYGLFANFVWNRSAGAAGADRGAGVAIDSEGNVVVTGTLTGTAAFSPFRTITSAGDSDMFVAKYDEHGNLLFALTAGGAGSDLGRSITTDNSDNIIVTGTFSGTAFFAPEVTLKSSGASDIFVVKYDSKGNLLWVRQIGGASDDAQDFPFKVRTDHNDNIIVTGLFSHQANFYEGGTIASAGDADMFLVKFDPAGSILWVRQAGGPDHEEGVGVSTDRAGNIYVAGILAQTAVFAPGVSLTSNGEWDLYLAKYDPSGNLIFARSGGGAGFDEGYSAVVDQEGSIILIGTFEGTATFAPGVSLTSAGDSDTYIAKFDPAGNLVWVKQIGGPGFDQGREIALDNAGNIYVGGRWFDGSITIAPGITLENFGNNDVFVAKFDRDGNAMWAQRGGNLGRDTILDIAASPFGDVYVTGTIGARATLGGGVPLISAGDTDFFLSRISDFNLCLQESGSGYRVRLNTITGAYQVISCSSAFALGGGGAMRAGACETVIEDRINGRRVHVILNTCRQKGRAVISGGGQPVITITDNNLTDNTCGCPAGRSL